MVGSSGVDTGVAVCVVLLQADDEGGRGYGYDEADRFVCARGGDVLPQATIQGRRLRILGSGGAVRYHGLRAGRTE